MDPISPKFKVGDVVNCSITSPKVIEEIRVGTKADFLGKHCDHSGDLCYVMRYRDGKRLVSVYSVASVDSDHHREGSAMFALYENARREPKAGGPSNLERPTPPTEVKAAQRLPFP